MKIKDRSIKEKMSNKNLFERDLLQEAVGNVYAREDKERKRVLEKLLKKRKPWGCFTRRWWCERGLRKMEEGIIKFIREGERVMKVETLNTQGKKYQAWVNNKVQTLWMTIQTNNTKDRRCLLRHEFFLEEIEHHYMDSHAGAKIWRAIRYLKLYLKSYPQQKARHKSVALSMLALIYGRLGFNAHKILDANNAEIC